MNSLFSYRKPCKEENAIRPGITEWWGDLKLWDELSNLAVHTVPYNAGHRKVHCFGLKHILYCHWVRTITSTYKGFSVSEEQLFGTSNSLDSKTFTKEDSLKSLKLVNIKLFLCTRWWFSCLLFTNWEMAIHTYK